MFIKILIKEKKVVLEEMEEDLMVLIIQNIKEPLINYTLSMRRYVILLKKLKIQQN
jgi:hypothetical protein